MSLPDMPSNVPGEDLTISPHAVPASDTQDNIIASHAGLLVRGADGFVQNFLESLSKAISAPRGTPCVRIPRDGGHDSRLMADSVPAPWRTPFHGDGGQHSILMADT